ncbi:DUF7507 domain-containing protein [Microbacterium timonense]|uniref:DUF7507 domain-containing protein n=1 Tax=Microbacterium timonense TaxID=2086576 RepID=UPI000D0F5954|nr:DUF11 domain-containing protein [Microbacterium timonense]
MAGIGVLALATSVIANVALLPQSAQAAPGDPFDPADPYVYIAQGQPTGLYTAMTDASGNVTFSPEGGPASVDYNAIAYNTADNYIYALVGASSNPQLPSASLVRVGQDGTLTRVGTSTYIGSVSATFGPDGYFYSYANSAGTIVLQVINVATGAVVRTTPITGELAVGNDMAFKDGFLWTMGGGLISRTNPATGATVRFTTPFPTDVADQGGAAWTFGNGNLGFSYNVSGTIYQIAVANAASAAPTFTLVSANPGPPNANNDGTASPGLPTDLSIVKDGPEAVVPGSTVTYTLTVTNNGPGNSSGFVVNDAVPAPLTNVVSTDGGCSITGNAVQCVGGRLLANQSVTYTITASVPAGLDAAVANTATVTSNEEDPTPGNNTSTNTSLPAGLSIVKHAGDPVDVNGNGITDAGDTIQYTFDVTNSGDVTITGITVDDPLAGAVTCPQTSLDPGAGQLCAADDVYTITAADVASGSVENTATVRGTTPDGEEFESTPSTTSTSTTAPDPGITVVKSADLEDTTYEPGQVVTYHFVVSNTGNVPLTGITVDEGDFSGTGDLSAVDCPATTLAVGDQMVCQATYTLTAEDVDAGQITNSATATGTPVGGTPITSDPSEAAIPTPAEPGISVAKTAAPGTVSTAGQTITYSFLVTNTGNVTLSDVAVDDVDFSGSGELSAIDCPATMLYAGQVQTCEATYTVTQDDVDAGILTNTATAGGTPPGDAEPITSEPSSATVGITQSPALTVEKTVDVDAAEVGQTVTYSFLVSNTGNVTITDLVVNDTEFSGSGELSAITCPADSVLAPGDDVTCTATYTVTQADIDAGEVTNTATVTGTPPAGDPITSVPSTSTFSTDPLPSLTVTKTADVDEITAAGQIVTYSFQVRNTGNVTITDPTVTEGEFTGRGELSAVTCPDGASVLDPGETVTCTATYTVVAADLTTGRLTNTATVSGSLPGGGSITSDPSTSAVTVNPPRPAALPATGGEISGVVIGAGLVLLALGGGILVVLRLRRRAQG